MNHRINACVILLGLLCSVPMTLRAQDAEGCKDSPLVTRMRDSEIRSCDNKEYEQLEVAIKDPAGERATTKVEGEWHAWDYGVREGSSQIQVYRNLETALKKAGFTAEFGDGRGELTMHKGNAWIYYEIYDDHYYQTVVLTKAMEQEVTGDAASLAAEIQRTGHVAVYGIHFETGKAAIQGESEKALAEILTLLKENVALKLRVEGHTDNQGAATANQMLSDKRAQAVVGWLTGHGVSASRLTAAGLGQTRPVADNATDAGRAKNRRVELVKQ